MRVSNISEYQGYSEKCYDGYQCTSQYVTVSDGCKLAIDIYRPTQNGILHEEPLPVVWEATPYRRARIKEDGSRTYLEESLLGPIAELIEYGYVMAILDVRGTGASYGVHGMQSTMRDFYDVAEVSEWLAAQPWCSGKTGMYGESANGKTQLMAAMMAPPSLKCIMPDVAVMDNPAMSTNGVANVGWMANSDKFTYYMAVEDPAPPVDEDVDGSMHREAIEMHKQNPPSLVERAEAPYFDDILPYWNTKLYIEAYYPNFIHNLDQSGCACYFLGGWKDFYAHDSVVWYCTLKKAPKRLVMGPWLHAQSQFSKESYNFFTEHHRWYDYWLKDIDNGIMDEDPVWLYQNGEEQWRSYSDFPISEKNVVEYYLNGGKSGTIESVNDGSLTVTYPRKKEEKMEYTVDYSVTKRGYIDRFYFTLPGSEDYTEFEKKCLTFTSEPMTEDVDIVGFPVAHLWIAANVDDIDVYVNLQEIDENGVSSNITEERIRASFRKTYEPAFNNLGLPYHRLWRQDQEKLPIGEPVKLDLTLLPMANTIRKGHRMRLTIYNYDKDNWNTPILEPAPIMTLYHNGTYTSSISLPMLESGKE